MAAGANRARATPLPPRRHGRPRATGAARLLDKRRLDGVHAANALLLDSRALNSALLRRPRLLFCASMSAE